MNLKALVKSETTFLKRVCPLLYPNVREGVNALTIDSHLSFIDHIINVCVNKALEEELVSQSV